MHAPIEPMIKIDNLFPLHEALDDFILLGLVPFGSDRSDVNL